MGPVRNEMQKNKNLKSGQKPDPSSDPHAVPPLGSTYAGPGHIPRLCASWRIKDKKRTALAVFAGTQGYPLPPFLYSVVPRYHHITHRSRMESHLL